MIEAVLLPQGGEAMKLKRLLIVSVLAVLPSFSVLPLKGHSQGVTLDRNNSCSLSDGTLAYAGTRYNRQGETNYYRCWYVLGQDAQPAGVAWIPGQVKNSEFFVATSTPSPGGVCTRPGILRYSTGAVVIFGGSVYRCSTVVGPDLKPSGVAWVEVEVRDNESFLIKGQR